MLQHAAVLALLLFVPTCAGCGSDRESSRRYVADVFSDVTIDRGLAYGSAPSLLLDLYRPAADDVPQRPAVVWVHGGGFVGGDRGSSVIPLPQALAKAGYVVASIDYDTTASSPCIAAPHLTQDCRSALETAVDDAREAVRWVKRNAGAYGIDAGRVAIAGESSGALTAAVVGTRADDATSSVRAWISISGGIDGASDVDSHAAPGLLFAGTADSYVPYAWSADTDAALRRAGVRVQLVTIDGGGHVPASESERFIATSRAFLRDTLDL